MRSRRPNVARRTLVWWFAPPTNPYVTANFVVDASFARAWLERVNAGAAVRITLNHLVAAAIARTLVEHPYANGRVIGQRIVLASSVGIAMPVNLLGNDKIGRELSMTSVEAVESLTLRDLADRTTRRLSAEREGKAGHPLMGRLIRIGEAAPHTLFKVVLHAVDTVANTSYIGDHVYRALGVTTALSNVGAAIRPGDGLLFRGADVQLPNRLLQVGTFWGTSVVQDEVIPVDGVPAVRPMLPCLLIFDHRLVDGVRAARVIQTFGALLRDPQATFGDGDTRIGG